MKRRSSLFNADRIDHLYKNLHEKDVEFFMHHGDMTDLTDLIRIIQQVQPYEIYNLAGGKVMYRFRLIHPNIRPMQMVLAYFVYWKQSASWDWKRKRNFIRHPLAICTVLFSKLHRRKQHHFIHATRMLLPSYMVTELP